MLQASYGVEDAEFAVVQLAQTTMRSELGKIKLDSVFQERMNLNRGIVGEPASQPANVMLAFTQIHHFFHSEEPQRVCNDCGMLCVFLSWIWYLPDNE